MSFKRLCPCGAFLVAMWLLPAVALAQSTIAGVVTDDTGAVLPGVSVEVASPALIEKVRAVVSDGQGRYSVTDVRPGEYSVTFTLQGFTTVRREGVAVASGATVPINGEMRIGTLNETVTVTGASPVVDVQTTARRQVVDREFLEALPNTGNVAAVAAFVPGVRLDVGAGTGASRIAQTYAIGRGLVNIKETSWNVDGLPASSMQANGQVNIFLNEAMSQEVTYETGGNAENPSAGLRINVIPRDGGNLFHGGFNAQGHPATWVSNNITDELRATGFTAGNTKGRSYEGDGTVGGPILRDRLWFVGSYRQFGERLLPANIYEDDTLTRADWFFANQSVPQAVDDSTVYNLSVRMTGQVGQRHKLTAYVDRSLRETNSTNQAQAAYSPSDTNYYFGQSKWTSTFSNKLLLDAAYAVTNYSRTQDYASEALRFERGTPEWLASAGHEDLITGRFWKETIQREGRRGVFPIRHVAASTLTYVTGSHTAKLGVQLTTGRYGETTTFNGDLMQLYRNGVPDSVRVYNTPGKFYNSVSGDFGMFVQDAWTIKRLTVNAGARFDRLATQVDGATVDAGRFTPFERVQPEIKMPVWTTVSPRLGFAYDVFGNAQTAVKGSWGKFVETWGTGFAQQYNSVAVRSETRTWSDLNGDDIAQDNEIGPAADINFGRVTALTRSPDPDIERAYNLSSSLGVEHQLLPGLGATFMWYHREWRNLQRTDNDLVTFADYTPVDIVSPLDGTVITAFNLNAAKRGLVQQVDRNATDTSTRRNSYNAFELSLTGRLPGGGNAFGGWTADRTVDVVCDSRDDPNTLRFCDQSKLGMPFQHEFKVSLAQPLPGRFQAGFTLTSWAGGLNGNRAFAPAGGARFTGLATNWSLSRTTRYAADCLGPCTPGALVIPNMTNATLVVPLVAPGEQFTDRFVQVGLQLSRVFQFGEKRLTANVQAHNLMNTSVVLLQNQTFGTALGRPDRTAEPRTIMGSVRFDF